MMTSPAPHATAIELLPEPLMILDEAGLVLDLNSAAVQLLECSRNEIVGAPLCDFVCDSPQQILEHLRGWSDSGQLTPGSLTFKSGSGTPLRATAEGGRIGRAIGDSQHPLLVRLSPLVQASSSFEQLNQRLNRLHNEITERKRIQQELESSQEQLKKSHEDLERRVEERTGELLQVTRQLQSEIEQRTRAEECLRALSGRLLNLRDEERRRLARELHDSIGQLLAALQLNLALTHSSLPSGQSVAEARLAECTTLADQAIREVRTISYLLHPPMLDEAGLVLALQWYVDGFVERSKIKIAAELPDRLGRLPQEIETAVFRIAQEALTNIHRHSGSFEGSLKLSARGESLHLVISDEGKGIAQEKIEDQSNGRGAFGVGVRGMRERVKQLGGSFEISSANPGTRIQVTIPLVRMKSPYSTHKQAS